MTTLCFCLVGLKRLADCSIKNVNYEHIPKNVKSEKAPVRISLFTLGKNTSLFTGASFKLFSPRRRVETDTRLERWLFPFKELQRFFREDQGCREMTTSDALELIEEFEPDENFRLDKKMSLHGFAYLLLSPHCDIFDHHHRKVRLSLFCFDWVRSTNVWNGALRLSIKADSNVR